MKSIAKNVPAPDMLKDYSPDKEPDPEDPGEDAEGEDSTAKVSAMADFMEAVRGKPASTSEAEAALEAYNRLCDVM